MDQSTHDVRQTRWLNIITECLQRPASITAKQWLADNGVKEKVYYYWLRKFRREACEQIQLSAVTAQPEVSFAEFSVPTSNPVKIAESVNVVIVISTNGVTLEVYNVEAPGHGSGADGFGNRE